MNLSTSSIILGNIFSIIIAFIFGFDLASVMWLYWVESLIVGFFTILRITDYGIRKYKSNQSNILICLFIIHFSFFHLGYLIIFNTFPFFIKDIVGLNGIMIASAILFLSHAISFTLNRILSKETIPSGGKMIDSITKIPYKRIMPMHSAIIISAAIILFSIHYHFEVGMSWLAVMVLKLILDIPFHEKEHEEMESVKT